MYVYYVIADTWSVVVAAAAAKRRTAASRTCSLRCVDMIQERIKRITQKTDG